MITRASALMAFATLAPVAAAQTTVTLMHDNDEWADTEREYASGSRLSVVSRDWGKADWARTLAGWLPGAEPGDVVSAGFGVGHYFYVPENINATAPITTQRPYAGYLHGSLLLVTENRTHQDTWKLDAGVVGPASQSQELEEFFHNIFSGREMLGWDNQITDRFAVNLDWQRRWRNLFDMGNGLQLDVSPAAGLEAGTVSTATSLGLTVRVGGNLDADFGAPRAGPLGGSLQREAREGWSAYAFASANGRYQAHDIFLDEPGGDSGDPVRAGSATSPKRLRSEASAGVVVAYGGARLTLAWTEESKRYDQQRQPQRFGEVTLGWSF